MERKYLKGPREEPDMSQNFSSWVNRIWRLLTSHSFHPWYVPWENPAQSTWGRCWWKAIPWKNRLSLPEDAVDERLSRGQPGSVHLRTLLMKGYPMEKPAQSTWGRRWWKAIPWKNRLSLPEDAVDERLSHGKTGSVYLRTPLMKGYPVDNPAQSTWGRRWWKAIPWKNRRCHISGSSLEPFIILFYVLLKGYVSVVQMLA